MWFNAGGPRIQGQDSAVYFQLKVKGWFEKRSEDTGIILCLQCRPFTSSQETWQHSHLTSCDTSNHCHLHLPQGVIPVTSHKQIGINDLHNNRTEVKHLDLGVLCNFLNCLFLTPWSSPEQEVVLKRHFDGHPNCLILALRSEKGCLRRYERGAASVKLFYQPTRPFIYWTAAAANQIELIYRCSLTLKWRQITE